MLNNAGLFYGEDDGLYTYANQKPSSLASFSACLWQRFMLYCVQQCAFVVILNF